MEKSFKMIVIGICLLLIVLSRNIECRLSVNMVPFEDTSEELHQIRLLLFDVQKTLDGFEMRLKRAENRENRLLRSVLQTSSTSNTHSDVEMRLERSQHLLTRLLRETLQYTASHRRGLTDVEPSTPATPTLTYSLSGHSAVTATAFLNDQLFVSREGVSHVSVYSTTDFQLQRQLTIPGLGSKIYGLATCARKNVLYVSDWINNHVHKVDLSIANAKDVITWEVERTPAGLSVNRAGNILVACYSEKKVQEYTPTGSLVREISDSNNLAHAVEQSSGVVVVSLLGPRHGIARLAMDGHVIHSDGSEGEMDTPSGIAVDKDGYILVADYSKHRILIWNPMLTSYRQLPLPVNATLQNPLALCLDQTRGRLFVGESGGQNRLLVIDNVTNVGALFDDDNDDVI